MLSDLFGRFRYGKTSFVFKQGLIHQDYLNYLYEVFSNYCPSKPKITHSLPDPRTKKIYIAVSFTTFTLPCFNELYHLFYLSGKKKVIPSNIGDYLTHISLAFWICDDGSWNSAGRYVTLCTDY